MKNQLSILVAVIVLIILVGYMFTFQVRFDEVVVLTTFGSAEQPTVTEAGQETDAGSVKRESGWYPKWPWPVQTTYSYTTKLQILEDELTQLQTADGFSIAVQTYLVWRISDPYDFYKSVQNLGEAQRKLQPLMKNLQGVITEFNFTDMVNADTERFKLSEIEAKARQDLTNQLKDTTAEYGIEVVDLGIRRLVLPETTTEKVFDRMRTTRERMAQNARTEGETLGQTIRKNAEQTAARIRKFAEARAAAIEAEGFGDAITVYDTFKENEELAVFLRQLEAMKKMLPYNTIFVLSADDIGAAELMAPMKDK